jgi:hypothetical protein
VEQDWGARQIAAIVRQTQQAWGVDDAHTVLFSVWDPARCFEYRDLPWAKWGYFAVDGHNARGSFGGPAAEAVRHYQRVLGYGRYGAEVLKTVVGRDVEYLPHGHWVTPERVDAAWQEFGERPQHIYESWRLGCIASNTVRKDLGLFFRTLKELRGGAKVYGWLHVDTLVTAAWSVPELLDVYDIPRSWLTISTPPSSDEWLLAQLASCAATIAVGRGEGFCYPLIESLAAGRGVVHVDYAGGAELVPRREWRIGYDAYDVTNPYALQRPLLSEADCAAKLEAIATEAMADGSTLEAYCQASVAHLHWSALWPRWESWFRQGLEQIRKDL